MKKIKIILYLNFLFLISLSAQSNYINNIVFLNINNIFDIDTINRFGLIDKENKIHISNELIDKIEFKDGVSIIKCNGKNGFINEKFEIIIPCKYNQAQFFYNNLSFVQYGNELFLINKSDSIINKLEYKLQYPPKRFSQKNNWIINLKRDTTIYSLDTNYNITIQDENQSNQSYTKEILFWDSFNNTQNDLFELKTILNADSCIRWSSEEYVYFRKNGYTGLADINGNIIIPPTYDYVNSFFDNCNLYRVEKNSKVGVFYKSFLLVNLEYDQINFYEDCYIVEKEGKSSILDKKGKSIIPDYFDNCTIDSEGFIKVYIKNKNNTNQYRIGYYNLNGEQITPIHFDDGGEYSEGLCPIKINEKWGYINNLGLLEVKAIYDSVCPFINNLAIVKFNNKWGVINQYGLNITDFKYDQINEFSEGFAAVCINFRWGYINSKGKEIVSIIYDYCNAIEDGIGRVNCRGIEKNIKITDSEITGSD